MIYCELLKIEFKMDKEFIIPVIFSLKESSDLNPFENFNKLIEANNFKPKIILKSDELNKLNIEKTLSESGMTEKSILSISFNRELYDRGDIIVDVFNRQITIFTNIKKDRGIAIGGGNEFELITHLIDIANIIKN